MILLVQQRPLAITGGGQSITVNRTSTCSACIFDIASHENRVFSASSCTIEEGLSITSGKVATSFAASEPATLDPSATEALTSAGALQTYIDGLIELQKGRKQEQKTESKLNDTLIALSTASVCTCWAFARHACQ
jgi:hypothetical protein